MATTLSKDLFPDNPTNQQVIVTAQGQYYQYASYLRSWRQIIRPSIPLATPNQDGLMSAADFIKVNNILLNPPQISLSIEGGTPVTSGYVNLVGDGLIGVTVDPSNITENTGLVNITLDYDSLAKQLISSGNITFVTTQGDQGATGPTGVAGRDSLPVGPYGPDGVDGANVEWPGALVQDNINVKTDNRAIVDVAIKNVSSTENYLVVTRANIGNPDACPDTIAPVDKQSPWLLCISSAGTTSATVSGRVTCSTGCSSSLYYLNIETIITSIKTQFAAYLNGQKQAKQQFVATKLSHLSSVFEEQKAAIACALERCRSKSNNDNARKYLQTMKVAAAAADSTKPGYNLDVTGIPPKFVNPKAYTPDWGKAGINYDSIILQDPEQPIVNPDTLGDNLIESDQ